MNDLAHFLEELSRYPVIKLICGGFLWLLSTLYGDFRMAYGAIITIVALDWVSGISFAWLDPLSKIESTKMRAGAVKLVIYAILLSIGHLSSLIELAVFVQAPIEGYIFITELISVVENVYKISVVCHTELPWLNKLIAILQGRLNKIGGDKDGQD